MSLGFSFQQPGYFPAFTPSVLIPTVQTGFIETTLYPVFYKHITVEFSIPSSWGNCTFDIYRGDTDSGPWEKATPTPISGTFFRDDMQGDVSKSNDTWYTVECRLPDGRRIQGAPVTWRNKRLDWVELRANEITRREILLLEKFVGIKSVLFKRKYFGMRCRDCWNPDIEKVIDDHCTTCLGTSFEGGFLPGYPTLLQYDPLQSQVSLGYEGKIENTSFSAWTIARPVIDELDLVLRVPDWKLLRVEKVSQTELQTIVVKQTLDLIELAKDSVEYELIAQAMPQQYFT